MKNLSKYKQRITQEKSERGYAQKDFQYTTLSKLVTEALVASPVLPLEE